MSTRVIPARMTAWCAADAAAFPIGMLMMASGRRSTSRARATDWRVDVEVAVLDRYEGGIHRTEGRFDARELLASPVARGRVEGDPDRESALLSRRSRSSGLSRRMPGCAARSPCGPETGDRRREPDVRVRGSRKSSARRSAAGSVGFTTGHLEGLRPGTAPVDVRRERRVTGGGTALGSGICPAPSCSTTAWRSGLAIGAPVSIQVVRVSGSKKVSAAIRAAPTSEAVCPSEVRTIRSSRVVRGRDRR